MSDTPVTMQPQKIPRPLWLWRVYYLLAAFQGIFALIQLLRSGSGANSTSLLMVSSIRLAMLGITLLIVLILTAIFLDSLIRSQLAEQRAQRTITKLARSNVWGVVLIISGAAIFACSYLITLVPEINEPFTRVYIERLLPLIIWGLGVSTQTFVLLLYIRYQKLFWRRLVEHKLVYLLSAALGLLFLVWAWVTRQIYPVESQLIGWNDLAAPVLETQLFLAWAAGAAALILSAVFSSRSIKNASVLRFINLRRDLLIGLVLWLGSFLLWQSIPIQPNWFVTEPGPPNLEYYPKSDAFEYDVTAQAAIVGEGYRFFNAPYIRRPLHALYLTILHLIAGQDYESIVTLQIAVLAFLPAAVYFLAKIFNNQPSALILAIMVSLREANSIAVGGSITTSHAKLLMIDLPTTFAVVCFVIAATAWLQRIDGNPLLPMIAGGSLGIAALIRNETLIFILPLGIISCILLWSRKQRLLWLKSVLLLLSGILLVLSPWIWRNWNMTGLFFLDSPYFRFDLITQRFQQGEQPPTAPLSPQAPEAYPTPESQAAPVEILPPLEPSPTPSPEEANPVKQAINNIIQQTFGFITEDPVKFASIMLAHYANSQMQAVLILPTSVRPLESLIGYLGHRSLETLSYDCCSVQGYVRKLPYWHKWDGKLPRQSILPLIFSTIIIAVGIYISWRHKKLVGITPLIFFVTYIFFNAFFRNSGGRYVLPVDWIFLLYFCIGLTHLTSKLIQIFTKQKQNNIAGLLEAQAAAQPKDEKLQPSWPLYALVIGFLIVSTAIPIFERIFPPIFTEARKEQMLDILLQTQQLTKNQSDDLKTFLENGGIAIAGRALYPIHLKPDIGVPTTSIPGGPQPFPRLTFYLAGPVLYDTMVMPSIKPPATFPNASDLLVIGCPPEDILAVALFNPSGELENIILRSPYPSSLACPLPPVEN